MTQAAPVTERAVRAAAEETWGGEKPRREGLLLLRAAPDWHGPEVIHVAGAPCRVVSAASTLAVRDALVELDDGGRLVVLTDVDEEELGTSLLAHAVRQRVQGVDVWDAVRQAFRVRRPDALDSGLPRDGEVLGRALLDEAPAGGWTPPAGGVLTRDAAYQALVGRLMGLEPHRLDVAGLLDWTRLPEGVLALRETEPPLRRLLVRWLVQRLEAAARPVLDVVLAGHGTDAVALGVAAGLLWGEGGTGRAQGAFEQRVLGRALGRDEVAAWSEASVGWVERALISKPTEAREVLSRAEQALAEVHAKHLAEASLLLPAGLTRRLADLGEALQRAAASLDPGAVGAVERTTARLDAHRLAEIDGELVGAALMGTRLVRWLSARGTPRTTAHEALTWQVREGGWVDRARQVVWNGVDEPALAAGLSAVFAAASTARVDIDRAAGRLVARAVATDQRSGQVVPVEEALRRLVQPLAEHGPVLLLVLDGMSAAVATELAEHVGALGWDEVVRSEGQRQVLMAGLPSVTEVSRTSLLTGRLQRGGQADERRDLPKVVGEPAVVFHLADLAGSAGSDLPVDVREALLDAERPVVAAVLNAVDDSLSGGDPARTRWTADAVRHLRPLLERAGVAGRTVILTSDHGHVVDRPDSGEVRRTPGGGARWRPAEGDPAPDEVLLAGPRVVLGGGRVVAAVDETLRYTPRKEGYHGGAALAELAIPFLVLVRRGTAPPSGWALAPGLDPGWWSAPLSRYMSENDKGITGLW